MRTVAWVALGLFCGLSWWSLTKILPPAPACDTACMLDRTEAALSRVEAKLDVLRERFDALNVRKDPARLPQPPRGRDL